MQIWSRNTPESGPTETLVLHRLDQLLHFFSAKTRTDVPCGRAEDAQGTPTQRHISPSILVYEVNQLSLPRKILGMSDQRDEQLESTIP